MLFYQLYSIFLPFSHYSPPYKPCFADPMRGYGCQLENCSEIDNNVCTIIQERRDDDHRDSYYYNIFSGNKDRLHGTSAADRRKCVKMQAQDVLDWSDISVFYNFGVAIESTLLNFVRIYQGTVCSFTSEHHVAEE